MTAMRASTKAKIRATLARKRKEKLKTAQDMASALVPPVEQVQTPSVDLRRVEEYNYRRGLIAALECIVRELR